METKPDKLLKRTIRDMHNRIKPGECQKYIRVVIDSRVLTAFHGRDFIAELDSVKEKISYDIKTLPMKGTIVWERNMGQLSLKPNKLNLLSEVWQEESHVLKILTHTELLQIIKSDALHTIADDFHNYYPNMQYIVLYFRTNEKPDVLSSALIELHIVYQLKVLQIDTSTKELVNEIKRLTKAIAEFPYKKEKSDILDSFKKFLANEKKHCVRVEGANGFRRLWQQHLNRLPLVTLEVAETIINKYSCPKMLLEDLKSNPGAVKEISDLKIKRSGPIALQTDRRMGNVLSYKIYSLYSSKDPITLI